MSFGNKVVIVTGASSGIGAEIAKLFAKEGANVVIVGRNETKLAKVAGEIKVIGNQALVIRADVSNDEQAKKIIDETVLKRGKINILVNNAGFSRSGTILGGNLVSAYDEIMATNVRAIVNLTALAAPHLVKTKGNIVNISSVAATSTPFMPEFLSYCTSKAALNHFSRGCALELSAHGVRVNIVSPGPVLTDFAENAQSPLNFDLANFDSVTALKRVSKPEEIADLVLFLASDKAKGITGTEVVSDNGYLIKRN